MKKIIFLTITLISLFSCKEEKSYITPTFGGFSGTGAKATWLVYKHTITDATFINAYLGTLVPVQTQTAFEATLISARQKEVSPYSFSFFNTGEVAIIPTGQTVWVTQTNMKWETADASMVLSKNVGGAWVVIAAGFPDEEKLTLKLKRSFFGDTTIDKDKFVMDILYTRL